MRLDHLAALCREPLRHALLADIDGFERVGFVCRLRQHGPERDEAGMQEEQ